MIIYYVNLMGERYYQDAYHDLPTIFDVAWWIVPGTISLED